MSELCALCPPHRTRQSRDGGVTCWRCHDRLHTMITEVVDRYLKLDPSPGGGSIERRAPGFRSVPPLNLHVVALRDPRTRPLHAGDPYCALTTLRTWATRVRQARQQEPLPSNGILAVADYLQANLDWITRHPDVVGLCDELDIVRAQLRNATGEPNPKPVGWCVAPVDDHFCSHPLFPPREGEDVVTCAGCGAVYDHLSQIRMRLANEFDPSPTCRCGHAGPQHNNDVEDRPCNVRWCQCESFRLVEMVA